MTDTRQFAVFSCDLDTVDRHLQGYGIDDLPACDRIYRTAVPRLLELLDELRVPGVFFFIARDAEREAPLLRQMIAAGHEVGSHSMTHPQPFRTLDSKRSYDDGVVHPECLARYDENLRARRGEYRREFNARAARKYVAAAAVL